MLGKIIEFVKACGGAPGVEEEWVEQRKLENECPFFQCGSVLYLGNRCAGICTCFEAPTQNGFNSGSPVWRILVLVFVTECASLHHPETRLQCLALWHCGWWCVVADRMPG